MTDTIFINGVVIHARHGVMEHETEVGQRFVIDLELTADLSESSRTDRLADTVSYSNVVVTATPASTFAQRALVPPAGQTTRSTIIFLISAIALAGLRPLGQTWAQFRMVWQR